MDREEIHPICFLQPQEQFVTVTYTPHWLWDSIIKNWDKIATICVAVASLIVSIIALIKR